MATTQKVVAVLRKAGLPIAKYEASRTIRGWGEWTPGCRVRKVGNVIRVDLARAAHESVARDALRAAGLTVDERGTVYAKWLEVTA